MVDSPANADGDVGHDGSNANMAKTSTMKHSASTALTSPPPEPPPRCYDKWNLPPSPWVSVPVSFIELLILLAPSAFLPDLLLNFFDGSYPHSAISTGVADSVGGLVAFIMSPWLGRWSDIHGRKKIVLATSCISFIPTLCLSLYPYLSLWAYLVTRSFSRWTAFGVFYAMISDVVPNPSNRARYYTQTTGCSMTGLCLGPLLSMFLDQESSFRVCGGLVGLALIYLVFLMPETLWVGWRLRMERDNVQVNGDANVSASISSSSHGEHCVPVLEDASEDGSARPPIVYPSLRHVQPNGRSHTDGNQYLLAADEDDDEDDDEADDNVLVASASYALSLPIVPGPSEPLLDVDILTTPSSTKHASSSSKSGKHIKSSKQESNDTHSLNSPDGLHQSLLHTSSSESNGDVTNDHIDSSLDDDGDEASLPSASSSICNPLTSMKVAFRSPSLRRIACILLLSQMSQNGLIEVAMLYLKRHWNFTKDDNSHFLLMMGGWGGFCMIVLAPLILKFSSEKRILLLALAMDFLHQIGYMLLPDKRLWPLIAFCQGLGFLAWPSTNAILSQFVSEQEQGAALNLGGGIRSLTQGVAPIVFSGLFSFFTSKLTPVDMPQAPFIISAICIVIAWILALGLPEHKKKKHAQRDGLDNELDAEESSSSSSSLPKDVANDESQLEASQDDANSGPGANGASHPNGQSIPTAVSDNAQFGESVNIIQPSPIVSTAHSVQG